MTINAPIEMTQHAVGQGGFFFGSLKYGGAEFCYAYDCGTSNRQVLLNREIKRVKKERRLPNVEKNRTLNTEKPIINALFISHFHADHISGLPNLLNQFHVKRVILPYLNKEEKNLLLLMNATNTGGGSADVSQQIISDAVEYLSEFGVEEVIFIPRMNDDAPDFPPVAPSGRTGGSDRPDRDDSQGRAGPVPPSNFFNDVENLNPVWCFRDHRNIWHINNQLKANSNLPTYSNTALYLKVPGTIQYWALATYVHPPCEDCFDDFREKIRDEFGDDDDAIKSEMRKSNFRKRIRNCFSEFWNDSNHDLISMTLYSGPTNLDTCFHLYGNSAFNFTKSGGILLTGDANFSDEQNSQNEKCYRCGQGKNSSGRRDLFLKHYSVFKKYVGAIMAPHHGSKYNFSLNLLKEFKNLVICYATAGSSSYKHPHELVRRSVYRYPDVHFQTVGEMQTLELKCLSLDGDIKVKVFKEMHDLYP